MTRRTPIQHIVHTHKRDGKTIKQYTRGKGSRSSKPRVLKRNISIENQLSKLETDGDLVSRSWGVDTEYTHGEGGTLTIGSGYIGGRMIGPDLIVEGTIDYLVDSFMKLNGEVRRYLENNDYDTKITEVDIAGDFTEDEKKWLKLFGKLHKIKFEITDESN